MSENSAELEARMRKELEAAFAAARDDAGFIASQGIFFALDSTTKTASPELYAVNLRGAQASPARPAAVVQEISFPIQQRGAGGCEIRATGTVTYEIFTGGSPDVAPVNGRNMRVLLLEALSRLAGIDLDTQDDLVDTTAEDDAEATAIYAQSFRIRQTTDKHF
jgi:hypothetical protein